MSHLEDIAIRLQVQLEGLKAENARAYNRILSDFADILDEKFSSKDIGSLRRSEVEKLIRAVSKEMTSVASSYMDELLKTLKELGSFSVSFEIEALTAGAAVESLNRKVKKSVVWDAVMDQPLLATGELLDPFLKEMTSFQIRATEGMIRRAHSEGWTTRQMLQTYRGTRQNRFKDGIVEKMGRANETVIRTAIQHVNSVGRMEVWKANDEIIKGYRWVSTLDSRTSSTCRSLDGQEFSIGGGPMPPIHMNCRSTTVPVLDEVFDGFRDNATRSSETGPVSQKMTYYEWLKTQPEEFQDSVLGTTRAGLLRDGGLTATEFAELQLNRTFEPLTLEEMRRRRPLVFKRAGF